MKMKSQSSVMGYLCWVSILLLSQLLPNGISLRYCGALMDCKIPPPPQQF